MASSDDRNWGIAATTMRPIYRGENPIRVIRIIRGRALRKFSTKREGNICSPRSRGDEAFFGAAGGGVKSLGDATGEISFASG